MRKLRIYDALIRALIKAGIGDRRIAKFLGKLDCTVRWEAVRNYRLKIAQGRPPTSEQDVALGLTSLDSEAREELNTLLQPKGSNTSKVIELIDRKTVSDEILLKTGGPSGRSVTMHFVLPTVGGAGASSYAYFLSRALQGQRLIINVYDGAVFSPSLASWVGTGVLMTADATRRDEVVDQALTLAAAGRGGAVVIDMGTDAHWQWKSWLDELAALQADLLSKGITVVLHGCVNRNPRSGAAWKKWLHGFDLLQKGGAFKTRVEVGSFRGESPAAGSTSKTAPGPNSVTRISLPKMSARFSQAMGGCAVTKRPVPWALPIALKREHDVILGELEAQLKDLADILIAPDFVWINSPRQERRPAPGLRSVKKKEIYPWRKWNTWVSLKAADLRQTEIKDFRIIPLGVTGFAEVNAESGEEKSVNHRWREAFWRKKALVKMTAKELEWLLRKASDDLWRRDQARRDHGQDPGLLDKFRRLEEVYRTKEDELDHDAARRDRILEVYFYLLADSLIRRSLNKYVDVPKEFTARW